MEFKRYAVVVQQHECPARDPANAVNIRVTGYADSGYTGTEVRCNRCGNALVHTLLYDVNLSLDIIAQVTGKTVE